jgi:hypothetical protein
LAVDARTRSDILSGVTKVECLAVDARTRSDTKSGGVKGRCVLAVDARTRRDTVSGGVDWSAWPLMLARGEVHYSASP